VFILKWKLCVFILYYEKRITFNNFSFINQSNWTIALDWLLLSNDLCCFVDFQSEWNTLWGWKYNVVNKSPRVWNEHFFFGEAFEIEKAVFIKYTIFLILSALNKLFCIFPCYRTEIFKLWKTSLQNASVIMNILNFTWSLRSWIFNFKALSSNKFLLSGNVSFNYL